MKNMVLSMTGVSNEVEYGALIAPVPEDTYDCIFLFMVGISSSCFAKTIIPLIVPSQMILPRPTDYQDFDAVRTVFSHIIRPCVVEIVVTSMPRLRGWKKQDDLMALHRDESDRTLLQSVQAAKGPNTIMEIFKISSKLEMEELYFLAKGRIRTFSRKLDFDVDVLTQLNKVAAKLRQVVPYYICLRQVYEIRPSDESNKTSTVIYKGSEIAEVMDVEDRKAYLTGAGNETVVFGVGGAVAYQLQNIHEIEMTKMRQKHELEQAIQLTKLRQQHEMDWETLSLLSKVRRENIKFFRTCLAKNTMEECRQSFKDVMEMSMD